MQDTYLLLVVLLWLLIDWHFLEVRKSIDLNENKHDASSICVVCSWKSRVSVTWPLWRHKTNDPHGSVTTWTKLNRKWSGKSVLKHAEWVCCSWLQWKVDNGVFFPCFSLKTFFVFKWSQKTTVVNGNESMGPSHKEVGTKTPRCALLKAFPKKCFTDRTLLSIQFGLIYMSTG